VLDKLVDLILSSIRFFQFATIIRAYERGVVLRFGRFHREIGPGFHWIWPFRIEEVLATNVTVETLNVGPQSLTTADDVSIVVLSVVTFTIADVRKFLLEVEAAKNVIEDSTFGIVSRMVGSKTWAEVKRPETAEEVTKIVRRLARRWGVDVLNVQFSDVTRSRSIRLISNPQSGVPVIQG